MFLVRRAREVMDPDVLVLPAETSFDAFLRQHDGARPAAPCRGDPERPALRRHPRQYRPRRGLEGAHTGVTLGDVATRDFTVVRDDEIVFDVIERMWRKHAFMAVVVKGRGVPRGDDVVGVITKEHVANSVAEQHQDLSELMMKRGDFLSVTGFDHRFGRWCVVRTMRHFRVLGGDQRQVRVGLGSQSSADASFDGRSSKPSPVCEIELAAIHDPFSAMTGAELIVRSLWTPCNVRLIFNTSKRQGVDCKRQSALKKRLGTTSWLLGGLGSVLGELPDGGRQSDAGGA